MSHRIIISSLHHLLGSSRVRNHWQRLWPRHTRTHHSLPYLLRLVATSQHAATSPYLDLAVATLSTIITLSTIDHSHRGTHHASSNTTQRTTHHSIRSSLPSTSVGPVNSSISSTVRSVSSRLARQDFSATEVFSRRPYTF